MVVSLKQRVGLGKSFLVILNSLLLFHAASDTSIISFGALHVRELIVIMILICFIGVEVVGYVMDKIVRADQMVERHSTNRGKVATIKIIKWIG